MSLKVMKAELQRQLDALRAGTAVDFGDYQLGLYKNNWTPGETDTISAVTPADFPGYTGLVTLNSWNASTWSSPRASITHPDVTQTHSGSAGSNDIYGYYVVDASGNLAWAEKDATGPVTISAGGQFYKVSPVYTRRSEF